MKRILVFSLFMVSLGFFSCSVSGQNTVKETRNVKGFTKISFGIAGDLKVKIGPEFNVVLEGEKNDLEEILTEVSNDRLQIKQESWRFSFREKVVITITMPEIEGLSVSGSGKAEIVDPVKNADKMTFGVSGSGKLYTAELKADEIDCGISGSGNIILGAGSADRGDISISGSGGYSGPDFEIDHADISISGSGNCLCKAGDSLKASISGSGNVNYLGDPKIDAHVSGSGHIRTAK